MAGRRRIQGTTTDKPFGPFSVSPHQISTLGAGFTPFVNELLRIESSAAHLDGGQLTTTYRDNIGDKGVDAGLRRAVATKYIPAGDSAWQFKAGDLPPAKCKTELRDAEQRGGSAALDVVRGGGTYRLVLGADLTDTKVRARRTALEDEATALGVAVQPGTFEVFNASDLAAWAAEHPALAVSPLLHGIDNVARPFAQWSASSRLIDPWVDAPTRDNLAQVIREFVTGASTPDLHIEGVSGIGKTRGVLEAIRSQDFEPLVAYVYAADALPPTLIHQLQTQARHTVLVIDECEAERHEVLAGQLPAGSPVKLITIGEPTGYRPRVPPVTVGPLEDDALRRAVHQNQPGLWSGRVQFVVDASAGNIRLALLLADDIVRQPGKTANELINKDIIGSYVTRALPTGKEFLTCCVLALLPYFGYDGEPTAELTRLADAFDLTDMDLRVAARSLAEANLLSWQGRYRSVTPHPLALYLAARGWEEFHNRIVTRFLPAVDILTTERLFQRATECGDHQVTKDTVEQLIVPGGLYGNIDVWAGGSEGRLSLHFAALAPAAVCSRVETVLAAMSDEELGDRSRYQHTIRWILERLAWRTATFRRAADALLRIAAAAPDIDSTRDTAVRSWTNLFGTRRPTTAVPPATRVSYLRDVAASADRRHRLLAVAAAGQALVGSGTVIGSAEMQGGVLLERRGMPATSEDAFTYLEAAITALDSLARDRDQEVANLAVSQLVRAIRPFLRNGRLLGRLSEVVASLPDTGLTAARTEVARLTAWLERISRTTDKDTTADMQGLETFAAQLPPPTPEQTLAFLANIRRWDLNDGELQHLLNTAVAAIPELDRVSKLLHALDRQPEAAYDIGRTLGTLAPNDQNVELRLVTLTQDSGQSAALVGYLNALIEHAPDAFDQLLDSDTSDALSDVVRLQVSASGPQSDTGWARVSTMVARLRPAVGARGLLSGWHIDLAPSRLRGLLDSWLPRIDTQDDYNAVVHFVSLGMHRKPGWIDSIDPLLARLVALRFRFGRLPQMEEWGWEQLARRQLATQPMELLACLLDLVNAGNFGPHLGADENESGLLEEVVVAAGAEGWLQMMAQLEAGGWRIHDVAERWLGGAVDVDTVQAWVAGSVTRARLVASVCSPGGEQLGPVARYLICEFGFDEYVSDDLRGGLMPQGWWGPDSALYERLTKRVLAWASTDDESNEVGVWIRTTHERLTTLRETALKQEADPDQ